MGRRVRATNDTGKVNKTTNGHVTARVDVDGPLAGEVEVVAEDVSRTIGNVRERREVGLLRLLGNSVGVSVSEGGDYDR